MRRPGFGYDYDAYAHLARVAEWSAHVDEEAAPWTSTPKSYRSRCSPADADRAQSDAADPNVSAWVSANAGTGKTHVLTLRVLRLLLAGTPPERILCLTYTKAAAAEMSKRVFDWLAGWVTADDATLQRKSSPT